MPEDADDASALLGVPSAALEPVSASASRFNRVGGGAGSSIVTCFEGCSKAFLGGDCADGGSSAESTSVEVC
jgi:hypothetical protein